MFNHLSEPITHQVINHHAVNSNLPFADYIAQCRMLIETHRPDLQQNHAHSEQIISANCPFELYPANHNPSHKHGALLIHGLLDCPFSLREIGMKLQASGIVNRAILLPGHGTIPSDLLQITYTDWIKTVRYGIETLKKEVDNLYLVGYSTGAALSLYHALQDVDIAGIIMLAPAIKIKTPMDILIDWHSLTKWFSKNRQWVCQEKEIDYAKYLSIPFNPIKQVSQLTNVVDQLRQKHDLTCKTMIVTSREDETICSDTAIDFFSSMSNPANQLLLYTAEMHTYPDTRIITRCSQYPDLRIRHFSHVSIPFSPLNAHYGQQGDYLYASLSNIKENSYGAYNRIEEQAYDKLYQFGLLKQRRRQLTYNPDFDFMAEKMIEFILA